MAVVPASIFLQVVPLLAHGIAFPLRHSSGLHLTASAPPILQEADEQEEELMTSAMEVVPVLAAKLPPEEFTPLFQRLHATALVKLCQASQPEDIRAGAVGSLPFFCPSVMSRGGCYASG